MKKKFYKISEVAEMMGMCNRTIRRRVYSGRIKAIKNDGMTGAYLIPADELEKYLKSLDV